MLIVALSSSTIALATDEIDSPPVLVRPVKCDGTYSGHLQGICYDGGEAIFWSFTKSLVKTDLDGRVLADISVPTHHGDLCYHNGRVYVAVNFGEFNRPTGADSWVYVYDAASLALLERHEVPELVHGAGGIAYHDGSFLVVGGLPSGVEENYLYKYDDQFQFLKRHVLASGPTLLGIQTATFADGHWWFGCYGGRGVLLKVTPDWQLVGKTQFECAMGIDALAPGKLLIGRGARDSSRQHLGHVVIAEPDKSGGLRLAEVDEAK